MPSPAQKHFQRVTASTAQLADVNSPARNAYELMLAKLHTDRARLRDIQSIERKILVKAEMLPDYEAWVDGVLASESGTQDDVVMSVLVWHIDVGQYARALDIAAHALAHGLTLPDQYDRTVATLIVDEISDAALACQRDGNAFDAAVLLRTLEMTESRDMPDQARAKLHKAIGNAMRTESPSDALSHYRRALELHDGSGVKRDIASLESELKKAGGSSS